MAVNFPLEIILAIFALATRTRGSAASWITCSKGTYTWFERLLYDRVVLDDEEEAVQFLQCLRLRKTHDVFARTFIKGMYLAGDIQGNTALEILSVCEGIENLALEIDSDDIEDLSELQPVLNALPLTVFHMHIGIAINDPSMTNANFFSRLTHLDIDNDDLLQHVSMDRFPRLTHLALWGFLDGGVQDDAVSLITRLLEHTTLTVIMFREENHQPLALFLQKHSFTDARIVIAPQQVYQWDELGRGSMLLWEIAEKKANLPKPNHDFHRCFPPSALVNRLRHCMDLDRITKRSVDYRVVDAFVVGPGIEGRQSTFLRSAVTYGSDDDYDDGDAVDLDFDDDIYD